MKWYFPIDVAAHARSSQVFTLAMAMTAGGLQAGLLPRDLDGDRQTIEAYYDDVLDITWLADANLPRSEKFGLGGIDALGEMSWFTANLYIAEMNAAEYLGYSGWRLPTISPANGQTYDVSFSNDGSTNAGTGNYSPGAELSYNFHINLGFAGKEIWVRNPSDPTAKVSNPNYQSGGRVTAPFVNLSNNVWDYWYGSELDANNAFLTFRNGDQGRTAKTNTSVQVWPVHDGKLGVDPAAGIVAVTIEPAHVIKFETEVGKTYVLEKSSDVDGWMPTGQSLVGDGEVRSFCVEADQPREFYRVSASDE